VTDAILVPRCHIDELSVSLICKTAEIDNKRTELFPAPVGPITLDASDQQQMLLQTIY
jgi:hypothetical protein